MPGKRILVVDDDRPTLELMRQLLEREGHEVRTATSQTEALRAYEAADGAFDLLVTDIVLPGSERGYELAWRLTERDPQLRVLLVSAHAQLRDGLVVAVPSPRSAFIEKPFDLDVFVTAVRTLLA